MKHTIGFIGTGNMGGALATAACRGLSPDDVIVTNRSVEKARALAEKLGCHIAEDNKSVAQSAKFIMLGVKPQNIHEVTKELSPYLTEDKVLISMAAGVTIKSLEDCLERPVPVIRILPNTPCAIGKGMTLISASDNSSEYVEELKNILSSAGDFEIIPESLMDCACVASGCAPAYAYMFINAIAKGTEAAGLPYETALKCAASAVLGAAAMVLETGENPDDLKNKVCSPGGSTIEGVKVLEADGLYETLAKATYASYQRNIQLGKR